MPKAKRRTQRPSEAVHKAQDKKRKPARRKASPTQQRPSEAVHKSTPESRRLARVPTAKPRQRPRVGPGSATPKKPGQGKSIKRGLSKTFPGAKNIPVGAAKVGKAYVSAGKAVSKAMFPKTNRRIAKKIAKMYGF